MNPIEYQERTLEQIQYVFDSSSFIEPSRHYYDMGIFPCFWKWMLKQFQDKSFIILDEVFEELSKINDSLSDWTKQLKPLTVKKDNSIWDSYYFTLRYIKGLSSSNKPLYEENAFNEFSQDADPWLIAYARSNKNICIVTEETPDFQKKKTRIKIPDICTVMNLKYKKLEEVLKLFHPVFDCDDFDK